MHSKAKYIQLIHIAKQKLAIDEYSYRAMLKHITGKHSTTQMSLAELMKVMHELEQKGFKKTAKNPTHSPSTKSAVAKSKIATKIRAIWIDMHKQGIIRDGSEQALNKWVRGIANPILANRKQPIVLNVQSLNDQMASLVLERLKKWQQRTEK
ncbi:hypothetical protein BTV20_08595 [Histophilus somni]|uniref:Regulatory protein GemA n=1 Tax=Histophilus somni TaxID=731 RepID=A0A9Q6P5C2_HISSO|nr:regulatory protein GemA [Histophilus somni]ARU65467.1 hypothetical protein BTV18_08145 [Histophilus somni]ARU67334.1 hypothetical protein BTV19_08575 [Histophilus somni]ARU69214.1 hypothetical protein BTV16_08590 [Histophilus somni]ARU71091.1 hypothetical protein BTV20_08595 [Histophilus somni]ARU72962.1 hypothetical protein BTV17_08570 [Histophilus somni]